MKKILLAILFGFGVFFGSLALTSYTDNSVFAAVSPDDGGGGNGGSETEADIQLNFGDIAKEKEVIGTADYDPEDAGAGFGSLMGRVLTIIVAIAGLILLIMLLWGAMEWITSGGDKGKVEKARNRITQSIIGMIVLAAVLAIFSLLQTTLNFQLFNITGTTTYGGGANTGGGGNGSGTGSSCTVNGQFENAGFQPTYCSQGSTMVKCFPPEGNYQSNHYNPCYCVEGSQYQVSGPNFDSC